MSPSLSSKVAPPAPGFLAPARHGLDAWLKVTPGAATDRVVGTATDADGRVRLRVTVTAAADRGRANAAVVALLAREWALAKSDLTISRGAGDRRKTVAIAGDGCALADRLARWAVRCGLA